MYLGLALFCDKTEFFVYISRFDVILLKMKRILSKITFKLFSVKSSVALKRGLCSLKQFRSCFFFPSVMSSSTFYSVIVNLLHEEKSVNTRSR